MKKTTALSGAAFLMATSAIGPGFLTQTSAFTAELMASFGFVIFISILLDLGVQLNIWQVICVSGKRAQEIAGDVLPGLGGFLALLIGFGGFVFNIGNMGGTGLGLEALAGLDTKTGAVVSCLLALGIFWYREAGRLMDHVVRLLGLIMILFTLYIAFSSGPPVGEALYRTFVPEKIDFLKIVTIVGGTVGGYISFAGAHRLLDAGISGPKQLPQVRKSAVRGILITSLMRYILFLAALGVVWQGLQLDANNPAGSVFRHAAGAGGYRFFGLVMWCAALTSVVGASYTSVSFIKTFHPLLQRYDRYIITCFILASTLVFLWVGKPVQLLIMAGAVNGLILPLALGLILLAVLSRKLRTWYRHPLWLQAAGWLVVGLMSFMGYIIIKNAWQQLGS